jgi:hypothetical protein
VAFGAIRCLESEKIDVTLSWARAQHRFGQSAGQLRQSNRGTPRLRCVAAARLELIALGHLDPFLVSSAHPLPDSEKKKQSAAADVHFLPQKVTRARACRVN